MREDSNVKVERLLDKAGIPHNKSTLKRAQPRAFHDAIKRAKRGIVQDNSWMVDAHSRRSYKDMKCYMSANKTMGVAITSDGDVVSVFSNSKKRGAMAKLLAFAVDKGGRKLDCYGAGLQNLYGNLGAQAYGRTPFDKRYAPKGWTGKASPDVVAMGLPKTVEEVVRSAKKGGRINMSKVPVYSDYGDMIDARDRALSSGRKGVRATGGLNYARARGMVAG